MPYKLIMIDDEAVIRKGMSTLINWEELGFQAVGIFENGQQGVDYLEEHGADIILTDVCMDGIGVARYVYEHKIPARVVLISGYSDFTAAQQAMELKVDAFLLKPVSIRRIKQVFQKLALETDGNPEETDTPVSLPQLRERQQIVMAHILDGNLELAESHFLAFLDSLPQRYDMAFRSSAIDFFAGLVEHLRSENVHWEEENGVFPYVRLAAISSMEELRRTGLSLLELLVQKAENLKGFSKKSLVSKACTYIDENFCGDLTLEQTAASIFISPVYLSKIFKEITGVNFKNYVIDKRIQYACTLLRNQDSPEKVCEISHKVGYSDEKYFYQIFSRKMGCTPLEYRNQQLK